MVGVLLVWGTMARPVNRVAAALTMLETRCLPFVRFHDRAISTEGLTPFAQFSEAEIWWRDPAAELLLKVDPKGCTFTTVGAPFTETERARAIAETVQMARDAFSDSVVEDVSLGMEKDSGYLFGLAVVARTERRRHAWFTVTRWPNSTDPLHSALQMRLERGG